MGMFQVGLEVFTPPAMARVVKLSSRSGTVFEAPYDVMKKSALVMTLLKESGTRRACGRAREHGLDVCVCPRPRPRRVRVCPPRLCPCPSTVSASVCVSTVGRRLRTCRRLRRGDSVPHHRRPGDGPGARPVPPLLPQGMASPALLVLVSSPCACAVQVLEYLKKNNTEPVTAISRVRAHRRGRVARV